MAAQTYKYRPASRDGLETHLLTLYPGHYDDEIRVHLAKVLLSVPDDELGQYEALSYAWGSIDMKHTVTVVDDDSEGVRWPGGVLPITGNLDTALRCLRDRHEPRVLWIDALCIDQSNIQERNHQVQWMDQVYRRARRVVVFLGAASEDDAQALDVLTSIGSSLDVEGSSLNPWLQVVNPHYHSYPEHPTEVPGRNVEGTRTLKGSVRAVTALLRLAHDRPSIKLYGQHTPSEYLIHDGKRAMALNMSLPAVSASMKLISRPWFSRVWVIQEVRTMRNPSEGLLQYGNHAPVSWEHFRKGVLALRHLEQSDVLCQQMVLGGRIQTYLTNMTLMLCQREFKMSVKEFLTLHHFHCVDPRDRIYGVLSLLRDDLGYPVTVDYLAPVEAVFENFQRRELEVRGLWQLPLCHLDPDSQWDAPSWVPNQRSFPTHLQEIKQVPTSRFKTDFGFVDDEENRKCLRVHGIHVATVRKVVRCPPLLDHWSPIDGPVSVLVWCHQVASELCEHDETRAQAQLASKILSLCDIRGDYAETHVPAVTRDLYLKRKDMQALILLIFSFPIHKSDGTHDTDEIRALVSALPPDLIQFLLALYINLCRAFGYSSRPIVFATEAAEVGYGPASARAGDQVCTILGCRTDLLLRPVTTPGKDRGQDKDRDNHIIVGPVSLASNIRSEKVLGPLPAHVFLALDREASLHTFQDARTGTRIPDPRMEALGLGPTGTHVQVDEVKVSPEELGRHGIHVKPFFIV